MGIFSGVGKKVKVATGDPRAKGVIFEECALALFPQDCFDNIDDPKSKIGADIYRSSIHHFEDKGTKEDFWIESRFISATSKDGSVQWCDNTQMEGYKKIMRMSRQDIFLVIGLGGRPQEPDRIFCIDLERSPYFKMPKSIYEAYEVKVDAFKVLSDFKK